MAKRKRKVKHAGSKKAMRGLRRGGAHKGRKGHRIEKASHRKGSRKASRKSRR